MLSDTTISTANTKIENTMLPKIVNSQIGRAIIETSKKNKIIFAISWVAFSFD